MARRMSAAAEQVFPGEVKCVPLSVSAFGPHRFRHSLATTAAYADPFNPGFAASVLAISEKVNAAHYNQARRDDALRRFQEHLQNDRARTAHLAR